VPNIPCVGHRLQLCRMLTVSYYFVTSCELSTGRTRDVGLYCGGLPDSSRTCSAPRSRVDNAVESAEKKAQENDWVFTPTGPCLAMTPSHLITTPAH
jgi:hypothetical protein